MEGLEPQRQVDARAARFELAAVAVFLLGGYVFGIIWVMPALAVIIALGLGFGAKANLFNQLFAVLIADRLKPATATEPEAAVRFSELFAVIVLSVSTLLLVAGVSWVAWLVALIEAGICALHATTGLSVEAAVRDRVGGRRKRSG